ncbi:AbrB/MazE/SpoVT family DNA-binding domain-containing protein [Gorillibacterium sp. sgz5001074]|uniref:AbrB/MazE/SpoVT family DNA-binding domain-containing protein n=1 Tax=Gorillibacterium sp. sgz5001074 TaxID=3446695 RepID=UPI003F66B977
MSNRTTGIVRLLDPLGRVVIPKETRELLGIREEDALEFFVEEHTLMLRKYRTTCCMFCQTTDDLVFFKNQFICRSCGKDAVNNAGTPNRTEQPQKASISQETSTMKVRRRKQEELLAALEQALAEEPDIRQKRLAEKLGVSQGRISQLMKLIHERPLARE